MKFVNPRILRLKNYERARRATDIFTLLVCAILGNNLNIVFHVVVHNQFAMFVSQNSAIEAILIASDVFFNVICLIRKQLLGSPRVDLKFRPLLHCQAYRPPDEHYDNFVALKSVARRS